MMKYNQLSRQLKSFSLALASGLLLTLSLLAGLALAQGPEAETAAESDVTYWLILDSAQDVDEILPRLLNVLGALKATGQVSDFDPTPRASAPTAASGVRVMAPVGSEDILNGLPGVLAIVDSLPPPPPEGLGIQTTTPLTGQVTEAASPLTPIPNVLVNAYDGLTYLNLANTTTDAGGVYTLTVNSSQDQVKLHFSEPAYVPEWFDNKATFNTADVITTSGALITDINAQLDRATGGLVGTVVLTPGNLPLDGVDLGLYRVVGDGEDFVASTLSVSGTFTFTNLVSGSYKLDHLNGTNVEPIVEGFYDNQTTLAEATLITIPTDTTATVNITLERSAVITGLVTNTITTLPISNTGNVVLFDSLGNFVEQTGTDTDGFYKLIGFDGGSYKVLFALSGYNPEFYNDVPANNFNIGLNQANIVTVTTSQTRTDINAGLSPVGAAITGTVTSFTGTALANVDVDLFQFDQGAGQFFNSTSATTDGAGEYSFNNLSNGVYKVRVGTFFGSNDPDIIPHAVEWFNDANVITSAIAITITDGISQTNQDVQLAAGGCVSGRIVDVDGIGKNFATFQVLQVENNNEPTPVFAPTGSPFSFWTLFPNSDDAGQGEFRACGLATGSYVVNCGVFGINGERITTTVTAGEVTDVGVCTVGFATVNLPIILKEN